MDDIIRYLDLTAEAPIPERGIHSQTLSDADGVTLVLFAFAPGEELSEHTSARPAIVHVLLGEAEIAGGEDRFTGRPGTRSSWRCICSRGPAQRPPADRRQAHALAVRTAPSRPPAGHPPLRRGH